MSATYPGDLTDAEWMYVRRYLPPLSTYRGKALADWRQRQGSGRDLEVMER